MKMNAQDSVWNSSQSNKNKHLFTILQRLSLRCNSKLLIQFLPLKQFFASFAGALVNHSWIRKTLTLIKLITSPAAPHAGDWFSSSHQIIGHITAAAWRITVLTGCWPAMTEPIIPANRPAALLNLWKWWSGANEVTELEKPSVAARSPYHSHTVIFKGTKSLRTETIDTLRATRFLRGKVAHLLLIFCCFFTFVFWVNSTACLCLTPRSWASSSQPQGTF